MITQNAKLKKQVEELLAFGDNPEEVLLQKIEEINNKISEVNKLAKELKSLDLTPKQADEILIVDRVLSKIPKKEILGQEIVTKINAEPLEESRQIDFSHIKNAPKSSNVVTRIANPVAVFDEGTLITDFIKELSFAGAGVQVALVDGRVVVTITGSSSSESNNETLTDSGDHTTFTFANAPASGGVRNVWVKETGQLLTVTSDYSVSGTTLTATRSMTDGDGNAFTLISNYTF